MLKMIKSCKKGFTLIELLVVVLIIGILAAIALPQYKKATYRSRFSTLKNLVQSLYQSQQVYYMVNGVYANTFDKLDVNIKDVNDKYVYSNGIACLLESEYYYLYCNNYKIQMSYLMNYGGERYCVPYNDYAHTICAIETGNEPLSNGWYPY